MEIRLSRRNLETLLSKLNRQREGDVTACAIVKCLNKDNVDECPLFVLIRAVENSEDYRIRSPGAVHKADVANLDKIGDIY